ncbi:dockerin type I repeat-containing protein [Patescibacteria group bacterium]
MRLLQHFGGIVLIVLVAIPIVQFQTAVAQVAEQVEVTATVPESPPFETDTTVVFEGIAYPASTLTISEGGTVLSSIVTTAQAAFSVSLVVDPGTHTYSVWGTDADGIEGRVSNFTLTLAEGSTTTISGIFLGPSIISDRTTMTAGETLTLSGTTLPNGDVNVTLTTIVGAGAAAGPPKIAVQVASSDGNGRWVQLYNADDLTVSAYEAKAQAIDPITTFASEFSKTVNFEVTAGEVDPCDGMSPGDLNCDGLVNLVDFSILLFYWQDASPANPRADINTDGIVNITDFSIMLFYWTG